MEEKGEGTYKEMILSSTRSDFEYLRDLASKYNISYFNFRMGAGVSTSLNLQNGILKKSMIGDALGFSIQVLYDGGWGMAFGDSISREDIENSFEDAVKLAKFSSRRRKTKFTISLEKGEDLYYEIYQKDPLKDVDISEKIGLLKEIEKRSKYDKRVKSVAVSYSDVDGVLIQYNGYSFSKMVSANSYLYVQSIAIEGSNQQSYFKTNGALGGFEKVRGAIESGREASEIALSLLDSTPVKAGKYDIIMDPYLTGTFIHEAFGHAAEADSVLANESILKDKIGKKVGNEKITIIDDGSFKDGYGYIPFDSEGIPSRETKIVENGILMGYLHSLETASRMNAVPTGNGRAMSSGSRPIVRMTNTYLKPGDTSLDEMIEELKNGVLCMGWQYGYTEPADGSFMFKMGYGYYIENGEKKGMVRDAAISGLTLDVLNRIELLGRDLFLDSGHCGKGGQSVRVGSGGPYVLIRDMVIGGQ